MALPNDLTPLINELAKNGIMFVTFEGKFPMDEIDFEYYVLDKNEAKFKRKYGKRPKGVVIVPLPLKKPITWSYSSIWGKEVQKFERIMEKYLPGRLVKKKVGQYVKYGIRVK